MAGGSVVQAILDEISTFVKHHKAQNENINEQLVEEQREPIDALSFIHQDSNEVKRMKSGGLTTKHSPHYKYVHWSAHDDTLISGMMSFYIFEICVFCFLKIPYSFACFEIN